MTPRDHAWEFFVVALSWVVAIGALAFVVAFLVFEAYRTHRMRRAGRS